MPVSAKLRLLCHFLPCRFLLGFVIPIALIFSISSVIGESSAPVIIADIAGPINPATDDYLKSAIRHAHGQGAKLIVLRINTPGGLVPSMQSMVQQLLESEIPVVVYVTPSGGSATSAGVFITLAGHVAAMTPGTTIGAAHPVSGDGQDVQGDMRAKIENFAVSLIKAISEQRERNIQWAEQSVRESVSITDREALALKAIDLVSPDLNDLLSTLENRTVQLKGKPLTLTGLRDAPREEFPMSFKQKVINIIADPNVAILLGLGAMLGLGIEMYNPGAVLPGIVGVVCLLLSLGSAQVLPIDYTGVGLLLLGGGFFLVELLMPSFGVWGGAGVICFVLGSIYLIDDGGVFGGIAINTVLVGGIATAVGLVLLGASYLAVSSRRSRSTTGSEGMIGGSAVVKTALVAHPGSLEFQGKVSIRGELWNAISDEPLPVGATVKIVARHSLTLQVRRASEGEII